MVPNNAAPSENTDSAVAVLDSLGEQFSREVVSEDTLDKKSKTSLINIHIKEKDNTMELEEDEKVLQTNSASIWTEEQLAFLQNVEKILLFHIRITEIGSRKLELDSQLGSTEQEVFIKVLLNEDSYPAPAMVESADSNSFVPKYQVLLEKGEDRLTLMFDPEGFEMVVANLFNREHYAVEPVLVDYIEKIKKKQ